MAATTTPCGIIMAYYGPIWSNNDIMDYADFCAKNGYSYFIYGPKLDPYLRTNWKTLYPEDRLQDLITIRKAFTAKNIKFGIDFSPFDVISLDDNKAALKAKIEQLNLIKPDILSIGFDDYDRKGFDRTPASPSSPPKPIHDIAKIQTSVAEYIKEQSTASSFYVVPTYYSKDPVQTGYYGPVPDNYWQTFGELSPEFNIFWCGSAIIPNGFSVSELEEMHTIFKRRVTLWDNYPVNDPAWMRKSIANTYAFTARPKKLSTVINGHFANPMLQPELSKIPLMTLPQAYTDSYSPQQAYQDACETVCADSGLSNFMIHNVMSFREVSYDPRYGFCTAGMQQSIQLLQGNQKAKQEIEDWLEYINLTGLPIIAGNQDQYIVHGTYLKNSTDIKFTITADCATLDGPKTSTLTFSADQTGNLTDIANVNGQLTLISQGPLKHNIDNACGPFVPAGSYQENSVSINIVVKATCSYGPNGNKSKQSSISFTAMEAMNFEDITVNKEGDLTIVKKSS